MLGAAQNRTHNFLIEKFWIRVYPESMARKDPAAVKLGRRGGKAKVPKGFAALTPEQRAEMGRKAAAAKKARQKNS